MLCSTLCTNMPTHNARLLRQVHCTACCGVLQCMLRCCSAVQYAAVCYGVLQCIIVCVLQCILVCCTTLQSVAHPPTSYISSKEPYSTATYQQARSCLYTHTLSLSLLSLSLTHTLAKNGMHTSGRNSSRKNSFIFLEIPKKSQKQCAHCHMCNEHMCSLYYWKNKKKSTITTCSDMCKYLCNECV